MKMPYQSDLSNDHHFVFYLSLNEGSLSLGSFNPTFITQVVSDSVVL